MFLVASLATWAVWVSWYAWRLGKARLEDMNRADRWLFAFQDLKAECGERKP